MRQISNKRFCLVVFAMLLTFSAELHAWGLTGHRVVAEIAERNLNRKAKKEIKKLLEGSSMAYWANWPDEIRSDSTHSWQHTFNWHYVNFQSGLTFEQLSVNLENYPVENIYSAINLNTTKLKNKSLSLSERRVSLYFLIHLIGDLEQPLHIGREEDLGGNKIEVNWFSSKTNLHSVWDSKLIDYYKYSYTEYSSLLDIHSKKVNKNLASGDLKYWIYDSYLLADKVYDEIKTYEKLDYQYAYYHKEILDLQLLKGGLRLAKVLNEIFSSY
ncbi:S1/P1 nuclease [Apibacter sp. HY039]|uniref:S1/P1 nuclease n=1 Tax=Apibacter sp. HY039 TaxID=2501476 RepID=UPI002102400F|nr:S1/P1 nuclease [Apibacter sp. HY039]